MLVNPWGGVGGLTKANALDGGENVGGNGVLDRQVGKATGVFRDSTQDLPLGLGAGVGGGVSPAANTGHEGCRTISQLAYIEAVSGAGDASRVSVTSGILVMAAMATVGCRTISQLAYIEAVSGAGDASRVSVTSGILVMAATATAGELLSSLGRSIPWKTYSSLNDR